MIRYNSSLRLSEISSEGGSGSPSSSGTGVTVNLAMVVLLSTAVPAVGIESDDSSPLATVLVECNSCSAPLSLEGVPCSAASEYVVEVDEVDCG